MKSESCLSIILPIKNETPEILDSVIGSLYTQRRQAFEVIIVDDSDRNIEVTQGYASKLKGIGINVIYIRGENSGVGAAMVSGLRYARCSWVFFLDADNVLSEDFVKTILDIAINVDPRKTAYISFLSVGLSTGPHCRKISFFSRGLLLASMYLACFLKGLLYDKRFGFVNILRVWNKNFLHRYVGLHIEKPYLSYLDQHNFWNKVAEGFKDGWQSRHVSKVLVFDVRHCYEELTVNFICSRMSWYVKGYIKGVMDLLKSTKNRSMTALLFYIPIVILVLALGVMYPYLLAIIILTYTLTFLFTLVKRKIKLMQPENFYAWIFIPILLMLRSLCLYKALIETNRKR